MSSSLTGVSRRLILTDIYISTDVEADGPIPGLYSMLSLGAAAFRPDGSLESTFSANLTCLPDATQDPDTMDWWRTQPEAWEASRKDHRSPSSVMNDYVAWVKSFAERRPVFVAYPVGFDFTFVYWYMIKFAGESPFRHSAIDIRSYAMATLKKDAFKKSTKRYMPKRWFSDHPHDHVALNDAIGQGALFCSMLTENLKQADVMQLADIPDLKSRS